MIAVIFASKVCGKWSPYRNTHGQLIQSLCNANYSLISYISCAPNTQTENTLCVMRAHMHTCLCTLKRETHTRRERERKRGSLHYYPVISCTIVRVKPQSISGTLIRLAVLSVSHSVRFTHTQTHTRARLSGAEIAHFILRLCHFALLVYFVIFFSFLFLSTSATQFTLLLSFPARYSTPSRSFFWLYGTTHCIVHLRCSVFFASSVMLIVWHAN